MQVISFLNISLAVLSFLALIVLAIDFIFELHPEVSRLILMIDFGLCMIFFADFLRSFYKAKSKSTYFFTYGWIDLVSSIPLIEPLRVGRLARVFRVLRIVRVVKSFNTIKKAFILNKVENTFILTILLTVSTLCLSSIFILMAEIPAGGNITTAHDAIWWSFVTMTTVGYGDYYPISNIGRFFAAFSMFVGIGLFGVLTASLSSLLTPKSEV